MLITEEKNIYRLRMVKAFLFLLLSTLYTLLNREVPNARDMVISFDYRIPFIPWTILIYHLWYPSLWYLMYQLRYDEDFDYYLNHLILTKLLCVMTFNLFPTYVSIREMTAGVTIWEKLINLTYTIDKPFCAFPSSHVALATIAIIFVLRNRKREVNFIIPFQILVIIATLTTKQHVILDVLGGLMYALIVYSILNKEKLCSQSKDEMVLKRPLTKVTLRS